MHMTNIKVIQISYLFISYIFFMRFDLLGKMQQWNKPLMFGARAPKFVYNLQPGMIGKNHDGFLQGRVVRYHKNILMFWKLHFKFINFL